MLTNVVPYFETETFIATHAGIAVDTSWEVQRYELDTVAEDMRAGDFYARPDQWFSMKLATSTEPIHHTDKTVVSGHTHTLSSKKMTRQPRRLDRVLHNGKRVRLASSLNAPIKDPIYIWQDWDEKIVEIEQ